MDMFVVCIVMALDMLFFMPNHHSSAWSVNVFPIFNAVSAYFPSRHILLPILCLLIFIHSAFQCCNRRYNHTHSRQFRLPIGEPGDIRISFLLTVRLRAMLIGLEFIPGPVGDLVCEDGEDEDLAYRAGKRLVELCLYCATHTAVSTKRELMILKR